MKKRGAQKKSGRPKASPSSISQPAPHSIPSTRYLFFGGKGGVGKTTVACSTALYLLDHARDAEQILLFSTDPAHSLSDSLGIEIGDRITEVAARGKSRLVAYEMDARAALEEFKTEHRAVLGEIAERGTLLDESDINELLDLSLPGMDEVMALFELSELDRAGAYSRVVIDTAPSGHTSRLLRLPQTFAHMVRALDLMAEKHRYIVAQFVRGRRARADEVDLFLNDLAERIERVRAMLYDPARTSFTLVAIPEAMSVEETARYYELLLKEKVPVTDLVVNRVESEHRNCEIGRARAAGQRPHISELSKRLASLRLHTVPLMPGEVRGVDQLRRIARMVWEEGTEAAGVQVDKSDAAGAGRRDTAKTNAKAKAGAKKISVNEAARGRVRASLQEKSPVGFPLETRRLLIFGGKGGVGKTTAAAAAALALADSDPAARVLVFSTDPAHSLSDSFDEKIGELKRGVADVKNLDAMEIDPAARFEELKRRYRTWTDEFFASLTGDSRWEIRFDREAMRELVELAPPGIDEIAALSAVSDLLDHSGYTTIVLDTAPTGHLVRFLELPEVVLSWVRAFLKLLLKYRNVIRASGFAEELIALSKGVKRVSALLTDKRECEFIGVAIPERMSLEETARLMESLSRLRVPLRRLLINGVLTEEAAADCEFCAARRLEQSEIVREFQQRFGRAVGLFVAPQQSLEIRGAARLREHFARWRASADF